MPLPVSPLVAPLQSRLNHGVVSGNAPTPSSMVQTWQIRCKKAFSLSIHHLRRHVGVGLICAVAYFDPGNWGVDLEAGSNFGYRLLFVILLAGLFAILLQVLASRLGCVTGLDLASHCRLLLYSHPTHPLLVRWTLLYPLYALSEVAIIATDLAELLGSAIALCLLFPKLELWQGVLITTCDVIFLLCLGDPLRGKPLRWFEMLIGALVLAVMVCMCIIISKVNIDWGDTFEGYLPSKYIFPNGAAYISVGIIGATIMPHSLFLGSALATQDRISPSHETHSFEPSSQTVSNLPTGLPRSPSLTSSTDSSTSSSVDEKPLPQSTFNIGRFVSESIRRAGTSLYRSIETAFRVPPSGTSAKESAKSHSGWKNNSQDFVKRHIYHGTVDIVISLLGFAVVINSLILILASAVFFYGNVDVTDAGLFDAYDLIKKLIGQGAATIFALALLFAGQSSSIIATVAGQAVAEGFLRWRISPIFRRLLTRLIAVIPSMAVAIGLGRPGIDALLIASQVVLSVVLPFISFPLVYLTSRKDIMSVRIPKVQVGEEKDTPLATPRDDDTVLNPLPRSMESGIPQEDLESQPSDTVVDYSNSLFVTLLAFAIWLVIVVANVYVIVTLGKGQGGEM
ncbi:Manganese transporter smf1 [Stygiomarasmius scandens]|uniref:Manganese transporter smf1 n=1 Tax=Marasmiellus scandens TaxID=2682957 RepID=A0ABR1JGL8_9AGAR